MTPAAGSPTTVLHVPYTFFPDACGGTEVYVRALARRLGGRGYPSAVAAPAAQAAVYEHEGLSVHRFAVDPRPGFEAAYGAPDLIAANGFRAIVAAVRPAIVHLHARTAAVSGALVDVAHAAGAKVVFTYHTPTVSCARGTMMWSGTTPCDGVMARVRCSTCVLQSHGIPPLLGTVMARLPDRLTNALPALRGPARRLAAFKLPGLIATGHDRVRQLLDRADHVVAVCQWVFDVIERNGVSRDKITLSRQGLADNSTLPRSDHTPRQHHGVRIAYFGRLDRVKGLDLLVEALQRLARAPLSLDIYAVRQPGTERAADALAAQAAADPRIAIRAPVAADAVTATMADYDVIAIPSRWLETGPLVALEAFAAGVPVIGSDLGGIREIVRDGVDGLLVSADQPAAWAATLDRLAREPALLATLRDNILPPRTMHDCAADMAMLYDGLLAPADRTIGAHS